MSPSHVVSSSESEMSSSEANTSSSSDQSLKLALAISLLRSKLIPPKRSSVSEADALRWKRKAKERKQELLRLKEDLKEAEDASQYDLFLQNAACKCYFFDNLWKFSPKRVGDGSDRSVSDVLRRRFLRQVRFRERKRSGGSVKRLRFLDPNSEDEIELLRASVDFLVELCDSVSPVKVDEANFANWSHQAVDFILASIKNLLLMGNNIETIEGIVGSLVVRLVRRMCAPTRGDESQYSCIEAQFLFQHLIRKLGSEPYIGQRSVLSVSQRISLLAESLLFSDPFDDAFPDMHACMFTMIQLIHFLVSDYLLMWSKEETFDKMLFEESVASILHARKALELLESRNVLYVLYMDRVIGELAKGVGQVSSLQKLSPDILSSLFH